MISTTLENLEPNRLIVQKLKNWLEILVKNLPNIAIAVLVLVISYFVSRLVYKIVVKLTKNKISQQSVVNLLARTFSVVVVLLGLFLALGALNLGKTLTGLLSAAGVSGLVIGLALQGTLSNTFSGVVLSLRKNIQLGNWVETNGYAGEVTDINLNYFVLREADNNFVIIPNKTIIENPLKNFSLTTRMRVHFDCGVGYETDLEKARSLTIATINQIYDQSQFDKEVEFYYTEFGSSSINFMCRFWIEGENGLAKLRAKSKAIIEIQKAFNKEGINIPFPIRTLKFGDELNLKTNS